MGNQKDYAFQTSDGKCLEWMADLKTGKAQSIVSQLAARIHTWGLTNSNGCASMDHDPPKLPITSVGVATHNLGNIILNCFLRKFQAWRQQSGKAWTFSAQ